jgi:hypothetical protein
MNSRVFAIMLPLIMGVSLGCTARKNPGEARGAMPSDGKVRVLFTRVKETSDLTHYKWSFVGDRNWSEPVCSGATFTVSNSSKLNSPTSRGGCFTWEVDIQSKRAPSTDAWTSTGEIRGSNGKTAKLSIPDGKCVATFTRDDMLAVGDAISLGKIGQAPLSVTFKK